MLYPFSAIVGQDEMKLALLLNAINPSIGGVLIEGEKGTAKSTAVRALPSLLPPMETGTDAMTVVELPINATEDRVVGSINLEKALQEGVKAFEPGILHAAHQNILYVDEVNLLDDHIVDIRRGRYGGKHRRARRGKLFSSISLHPRRNYEPRRGGPKTSAIRSLWVVRHGLW